MERHDAVERFAQLFPLVRYTLEHISISTNFDASTQMKAKGMLKNTLAPVFCYALALLRKVLGLTKILSEQLQVNVYTLII